MMYGVQAMKDMASTAKATDEYTGPNSKEFPHTVPANNRQVHPFGNILCPMTRVTYDTCPACL